MVSVGAKSFGIVSVVTSLGSGFAPAAQSLALGLMPRGGEDAGKLFGGLAAVQALRYVALYATCTHIDLDVPCD